MNKKAKYRSMFILLLATIAFILPTYGNKSISHEKVDNSENVNIHSKHEISFPGSINNLKKDLNEVSVNVENIEKQLEQSMPFEENGASEELLSTIEQDKAEVTESLKQLNGYKSILTSK